MTIPALALIMLFQTGGRDNGFPPQGEIRQTTSAVPVDEMRVSQIRGQIVADTTEPLNTIRFTIAPVVGNTGVPAGMISTFADGSFRVRLIAADYWIHVVDPRFKMTQYPLFLRDDSDFSRPILVPLLPREGTPSVRVLSALARTQIHGGEFKQAVNTLNEIAKVRTLTGEDRYFLGIAHYKLGNFAAAQQQFEVSIALAPETNPQAYVQLFYTFQKNGKPAQALAVIEDFLRIFPKDLNRPAIEEAARKLRLLLQQ